MRIAIRVKPGSARPASRTKVVDIDAGDPHVLAALLVAPARN